MIKSIILVLLINILPLRLVAQEVVTITDYALEFSLLVPKGWKSKNTEYYFYVHSSTIKEAQVSFTYLESAQATSINSVTVFDISKYYPRLEPEFELLETGFDQMENLPAQWAIYRFLNKGNLRLNLLYVYEKDGQVFKLIGSAKEEDFNKMKPEFIKIIKSLKTTSLERD